MSESEFADYYALLGVEPSADLPEIRQAFLLLAKQHHPDAGGSTDTMQQLNTAYKTLTNASAKAAYDMLHSFHTGRAEAGDYKYSDGREVNDVTDMSDSEIDDFLDSLLKEYRNGPPKAKQSVRKRFKQLFTFDA